MELTLHKPIGLIAGQGRLPMLVARGMKNSGARVCCIGLRDQYDLQLPHFCDRFSPVGLVRIGSWIKLLKRWDVTEAVMVGGVSKKRMHDRFRLFRQLPDWRAVRLWYRHLRHDRRNAAVLAAVANELAANGITLIDSTTYIPDHLAMDGVMTRTQPTAQQRADIDFGWPLLAQTVELDIGQSIAARDRDVIAVEAVEGTDAMIERAGELCKTRGWTLLKTAKSNHDMRSDVPTIGLATIERASRAGCGCIALGVGRVILVDKPAVLKAADEMKIAVIGMSAASQRTLTIDLTSITDPQSFHELLAHTLMFPSYYGKNLDALDEVMSDDDVRLPDFIHFTGWKKLGLTCPHEAKCFREILTRCATERRNPPSIEIAD